MNNQMELKIKSISENESFARSVVSAFCVQLNPSVEELGDIKTAVSEAITNCVVHAYPNTIGDIVIRASVSRNKVTISVSDYGIGIDDIEQAKTPFYTTKPDEERSGMGFTVMEGFMDSVDVYTNKKGGITVKMIKYLDAIKEYKVG